jgi:hypothetical protein
MFSSSTSLEQEEEINNSPIQPFIHLDVNKMKKRLSLSETKDISSKINVEYNPSITQRNKNIVHLTIVTTLPLLLILLREVRRNHL